MKTTVQLLLALLAPLLISCATGKNAFDKGNYETAIDRAINRLQANPDNKRSKAVLEEGYRLASAYHLDHIRNLELSNDPFRWEGIYYQYRQLNDYYAKIQRCPACLKLVRPSLYQAEQGQAGIKAAKNRVFLGRQSLADSTIQGGRDAFRHFDQALSFSAAIDGIDQLLTTARQMGTVRVVVEPVPLHSRSLALSNEFFENQLLEYLSHYSQDKFVQFYAAGEAEQLRLTPDHIISMVFDDFVLGQTLVESKTREISRDSVIVGEYTDDEGVKHDVYGTVRAELTTYRKTLASQGVMNFEILDAYTGQAIVQRKLPGEDIWVHEWASYNGDKRALTKKELQLSKNRELPPPSPQTLFISFADRIYDQITRQVRDFYRDSAL